PGKSPKGPATRPPNRNGPPGRTGRPVRVSGGRGTGSAAEAGPDGRAGGRGRALAVGGVAVGPRGGGQGNGQPSEGGRRGGGRRGLGPRHRDRVARAAVVGERRLRPWGGLGTRDRRDGGRRLGAVRAGLRQAGRG